MSFFGNTGQPAFNAFGTTTQSFAPTFNLGQTTPTQPTQPSMFNNPAPFSPFGNTTATTTNSWLNPTTPAVPTNTNPFTMNTNPFGQPAPTTSMFGQQANPSPFGNNFSSAVKYQPTKDTEGGTLLSITAMPTYKDKSFEELRFEEYKKKLTGGTIGGGATSGFPFQTGPTAAAPFGAAPAITTTGAQGQPQAPFGTSSFFNTQVPAPTTSSAFPFANNAAPATQNTNPFGGQNTNLFNAPTTTGNMFSTTTANAANTLPFGSTMGTQPNNFMSGFPSNTAQPTTSNMFSNMGATNTATTGTQAQPFSFFGTSSSSTTSTAAPAAPFSFNTGSTGAAPSTSTFGNMFNTSAAPTLGAPSTGSNLFSSTSGTGTGTAFNFGTGSSLGGGTTQATSSSPFSSTFQNFGTGSSFLNTPLGGTTGTTGSIFAPSTATTSNATPTAPSFFNTNSGTAFPSVFPSVSSSSSNQSIFSSSTSTNPFGGGTSLFGTGTAPSTPLGSLSSVYGGTSNQFGTGQLTQSQMPSLQYQPFGPNLEIPEVAPVPPPSTPTSKPLSVPKTTPRSSSKLVPRNFSRDPVPFISGEAVKMFGGSDTSNRKKLIIEEDTEIEKLNTYTFGDVTKQDKLEVQTRKADEERERVRRLREEEQRREQVPKLKRDSYYTIPPISQLEQMSLSELSRVPNFAVGLKEACEIRFEGSTDVRGLDLDHIVELASKQIVVYPDQNDLPPVGEGLNKPAVIVVKNMRPKSNNAGSLANYEKNLRAFVEKSDGTFIGYDPSKGELSFSVKNFVNR
eukprot:TRINITY_DN226_c0_g1_i1.p1 TRINITY_DN226_c0_g1~~TRINITY_DN226_c0_g1_i1.p1  ORF type:complete len:806 (-),score=174.08 TRINITY_DN226_c0_g1_i1:164-2527(-)